MPENKERTKKINYIIKSINNMNNRMDILSNDLKYIKEILNKIPQPMEVEGFQVIK